MCDRFFPLSMQLFTTKIEPKICAYYKRPGRPPSGGHYRFFCGVLYVMRTGISWRDLPACFGRWHTVYTRFNRWSKSGLFWNLLMQLQQEKQMKIELVWVDSTTIPLHRHGGGPLKKTANSPQVEEDEG